MSKQADQGKGNGKEKLQQNKNWNVLLQGRPCRENGMLDSIVAQSSQNKRVPAEIVSLLFWPWFHRASAIPQNFRKALAHDGYVDAQHRFVTCRIKRILGRDDLAPEKPA